MAVSVGDLRATLDLETRGFARGAQEAGGALNVLRHTFEVFAGVSIARVFEEGVRAAKEFAAEAIKLGYGAKIAEQGFADMARAAGVNSEALVKALAKASGETVNLSDIMRASSRALQQGLDPRQIVQFMEIARSQSILTSQTVQSAFNDIVEAIASQRTRALKGFGIIVDIAAAERDYAKSVDESTNVLNEQGRTHALAAAALANIKGKLLDVNNETVRMKETVERARSEWSQFTEEVGKRLLDDVALPLLHWVKSLSHEFADVLAPATKDLGAIWSATWEGALRAIEPVAVILEATLLPLLKIAGVALMGLAAIAQGAFIGIAKTAAFLGEIVNDLGLGKLPNLGKAFKASAAVEAEMTVKLDETFAAMARLQGIGEPAARSVGFLFDAFKRGKPSIEETKKALEVIGDAVGGLGTNKLGGAKNSIDPVAAALERLGAAAARAGAESESMLSKLKIAEGTRATLVDIGQQTEESALKERLRDVDVELAAKKAKLGAEFEAVKAKNVNVKEETEKFNAQIAALDNTAAEQRAAIGDKGLALAEKRAQRQFDIEVEGMRRWATREEAIVGEQAAARVLSAEQASLKVSNVQISAMEQEKARTDEELSRYVGTADRRVELERKSADLGTAIFVAMTARRATIWNALYDDMQTVAERWQLENADVHERAMSVIRRNAADALAIAETVGGGEVATAERVALAQIDASARATRAILADLKNQESAALFAAALAGKTPAQVEVIKARFRNQRAAAERTNDEAIAAAGLAITRAELNAELAVTRQTTADRVAVMQEQVDAVNRLLEKGVADETTRQELLTIRYGAEEAKRLAGMRTVADLARATWSRNIGEEIALIQERNNADVRAWDLQTQRAMAYAAAAGDAAGFVFAAFQNAAAKLGTVWDQMKTAVDAIFAGVRDSLSKAFESVLSRSGSLMQDLQQIGAALKQTLIKAVSDFLASQALQALASLFSGTGLANVFRGLGGGVAGASNQVTMAFGNVSTAAQALAVALSNATVAAGGSAPSLASVPGGGGGTGGGGMNIPGGGNFSWSGAGSWLDSLFGTGGSMSVSTFTGLESSVELASIGLENAGIEAINTVQVIDQTAGTFEALGASIQGFSAAIPWVGAAIGVLTTILGNAPDWMKAVQSAIWVAGAALAGFTSGISLVVAGIVNMVLGFIDFGPSKEWTSFPGRLVTQLTKEGGDVNALGGNLQNATDLAGIKGAIDDFRATFKDIGGWQAHAYPGGYATTTGQAGAFSLPTPPGTTGVAHGIDMGAPFTFDAIMLEIQKAIDAQLQHIRDSIKTFGDDASKIMPAALSKAFREGIVSGLSKQFEALVDNADATADDVKKFTERVKEVGQMAAMASVESSQLIGTVAAAVDVLPSDVVAGVVERVGELSGQLIDLAANSAATVEDFKKLELSVQTLGRAVGLYAQLSLEIALMSGDLAETTRQLTLAAHAQLNSADRAIVAAWQAVGSATTWPEAVAAQEALHKAMIDRYALERKLIQEIEGTIANVLQTAGASLIHNAMIAVNVGIGGQNLGPLNNLITSLNHVQSAAFSASAKLWAAEQAILALTGAVPGIVKNFGTPGTSPGDLAHALYEAALPSLKTIADLYGHALAAGDLQNALAALSKGSDMILALANAAIEGTRQWLTQVTEAETAAAQSKIDDINEELRLGQEKNQTEIDALTEQRDAAKKLQEDWKRASESLEKFVRGLLLGTMAPPNPVGQMTLARSFYDQAVASYRANATTDNLQAVQEAAQAYLQSLQQVYTRPDPKYAEIFNAVVGTLKELQADAAARVTPEESMASSLASIDAQIKAQTDANKHKDTDAAARVKEVETARDLTIQGYKDAAQHTIDGINDGVGAIMGQIAAAQADLLNRIIEQQEAVEKSITGGLDPQSFLAQEAKATVALLQSLQDIVYAALTGKEPPAPVTVPVGASGAEIRGAGMMWVDPGETLVPASVGPYEGGGTGGGDVVFHIDARGADHGVAERLERNLPSLVADALRTPKAAAIIRKQAELANR